MKQILSTLEKYDVKLEGRESEGGVFRFDQHLENDIFQYLHHSTSRDGFLVYLIKQKKILFRKKQKQIRSFFWGLLNYLRREEPHQAHFYWILLLNDIPRHILLAVYKSLEDIFLRSGLKRQLKYFYLAEQAEVQVRYFLDLTPLEKQLWAAEPHGRLVRVSWIRQFVLQIQAQRHLKKKGGVQLKTFSRQPDQARLAVKSRRLQTNRRPLSVELSLLRVGQFAGENKSGKKSGRFREDTVRGETALGGESEAEANVGFLKGATLKETWQGETLNVEMDEEVEWASVDEEQAMTQLAEIGKEIQMQKKCVKRLFKKKRGGPKPLTCFRFDFRPSKPEKPNMVTLGKDAYREMVALDLVRVDVSKTNAKLLAKPKRVKGETPRAAELPAKARFMKKKQRKLIEDMIQARNSETKNIRKIIKSKKKEKGDFSIDYARNKRFREEEVRGRSPVKRRFSPVNEGVFRNHLKILKKMRQESKRRRFG